MCDLSKIVFLFIHSSQQKKKLVQTHGEIKSDGFKIQARTPWQMQPINTLNEKAAFDLSRLGVQSVWVDACVCVEDVSHDTNTRDEWNV